MLDVAASGGYYIALAADTIVAHPTSVTGSIGVVMVTLSAEGLLQKLGLSTTTIKSAERKDMGSPFRALTDEERKIFQAVIDSLYAQFVAKLAESRKLPLETARKVADGRIYTAQQALELKLIDRIGYMPDAIEAAKRAIGVEEARVVVYRRPREYRATYYARSEAPAGAMEGSLMQLPAVLGADRKSTRLNSSHSQISYAVFCLKKKNLHEPPHDRSAEASRAANDRAPH